MKSACTKPLVTRVAYSPLGISQWGRNRLRSISPGAAIRPIALAPIITARSRPATGAPPVSVASESMGRSCLSGGAGRMHRGRRRRGSARRPGPGPRLAKDSSRRFHVRSPRRRLVARRPDRCRRQGDRGPGDRLATRHSCQPRAGQSRVPHRRHRRRAPEAARPRRGAHRRRPHRRGRPAEGRAARPGGGPARRHGRAAGGRGGRHPVRLEGEGAVERRDRSASCMPAATMPTSPS